MSKDHFVPRFYIRQFCNADGRIFCLDKQKMRIPNRTRGNAPKEILRQSRFYLDATGDLDNELYKPIETAFAPHLINLAKNPESAVGAEGFGRALLEWVAAQHSRTQLVTETFDIVARQNGRHELLGDAEQLAIAHNLARTQVFQAKLRLMQLPKWKWHLYSSRGAVRFVLGDHPVCNSVTNSRLGLMLFVPISPKQLLVGGSEEGHRALVSTRTLRVLNTFFVSWCKRFVFSGSIEELEKLQRWLEPNEDEPPWKRYARQPHYGVALRAAEGGPPKGFDPSLLYTSFE